MDWCQIQEKCCTQIDLLQSIFGDLKIDISIFCCRGCPNEAVAPWLAKPEQNGRQAVHLVQVHTALTNKKDFSFFTNGHFVLFSDTGQWTEVCNVGSKRPTINISKGCAAIEDNYLKIQISHPTIGPFTEIRNRPCILLCG